nr:phage tail tape measure protein [uncultured Neokomagataea sp.]
MSNLTAQFELTLEDKLSGPIERIDQLVTKLSSALERIGQNRGFDEAWEPVPRCVEQTNTLSEAIERTTATAHGLSEGLGETAASAGSAGNALGRAAEGATSLNTAMERTRVGTSSAVEGLNAVTEAANRAHDSVNRSANGGISGGGNHGVIGSLGHLHEESERGINKAFGAAAAGFGLVEPVRESANFDNTIRHIGIGLNLHGAENDRFAADFKRQIHQLARDTGQSGEELAEAAGFFSSEGYNRTRLNAVLPTVARISTAYNANPDAVARSTFALQENMHITDANLPGALASVALAGKSAALPFEKLAPLLPQVAAAAGALGVTGRSGVDDLAAALAVVRKSTGTEGEATTDTRAFIQAITSPHTAHRFEKYGVDLFGIEDRARRSGRDPMLAVLQAVDRITHRGEDRRALGTLFNNEQDRGFVQAILMHMDQYEEIHRRTAGANQSVIKEDYDTGRNTQLIAMKAFDESWHELMQEVGTGFLPILRGVTYGFQHLAAAMEAVDKHVPYANATVLGLGGATLAGTAGIAAIGAISGPVKAGWGVMKSLKRRIIGRAATAGAGEAVAAGAGEAAVAEGAGLAATEATALTAAEVGGGALLAGVSWPVLLAGAGIAAAGAGGYALWRHYHHSGQPAGSGDGQTIKLEVSLAPGLQASVGPNTPIPVHITPNAGRMTQRP